MKEIQAILLVFIGVYISYIIYRALFGYKAKTPLIILFLLSIYGLLISLVLLSAIGCRTPAIELTYKAKCVASENDVSQFEYYYNCKRLKPCSMQFEAIGDYEVGKYYWVKYRR